jgi:hypothetical protein
MFEPGSALPLFDEDIFGWAGLSSILMPSSVRTIKHFCFMSCLNLKSVKFEAGSRLRRIEKKAFCDCKALESICLPAAVEGMERKCFACCRRLLTVTFEAGAKLTRIDGGAFRGCFALQSIWLPARARIIGELGFEDCPAIVNRYPPSR